MLKFGGGKPTAMSIKMHGGGEGGGGVGGGGDGGGEGGDEGGGGDNGDGGGGGANGKGGGLGEKSMASSAANVIRTKSWSVKTCGPLSFTSCRTLAGTTATQIVHVPAWGIWMVSPPDCSCPPHTAVVPFE